MVIAVQPRPPLGPSTLLRPDPSTLTTLTDILSSISALEAEDAELSHFLSELLSAQEPINIALGRIQSLEPFFNDLHIEAGLLTETVAATALTARRVGGKVRLLDEEMRRVKEAGEKVSQAMELKVRAIFQSIILSHSSVHEVFTGRSSSINGDARLGICYETLR